MGEGEWPLGWRVRHTASGAGRCEWPSFRQGLTLCGEPGGLGKRVCKLGAGWIGVRLGDRIGVGCVKDGSGVVGRFCSFLPGVDTVLSGPIRSLML